MQAVLDLVRFKETALDTNFFPYCQVDHFIHREQLSAVLDDFPKVRSRGSILPEQLQYGKHFQALLAELYGEPLRAAVAEKFSIDLSDRPVIITVRGRTHLRDGHIHTDTPSKLVTLLLYLNENWSGSNGNLRLLRDGNSLENYFHEVSPQAGTLLAFKVTPNCWHGHYPFIGKRQALQLNYLVDQKTLDREKRKHGRSYRVKNLLSSLWNADS